MKYKNIYYLVFVSLAIVNMIFFFDVFSQGLYLGSDGTILNVDANSALDVYDNNNPITDPLRQGAYKIVDADGTNTISEWEVGGIVNPGLIQAHSTAMDSTLVMIKNLINYALGLLALIALIYLIYHGFLMLTATGDDAQYKKGFKGLKLAVIALAGIGLSWLFVSLIFYIIELITVTT